MLRFLIGLSRRVANLVCVGRLPEKSKYRYTMLYQSQADNSHGHGYTTYDPRVGNC